MAERTPRDPAALAITAQGLLYLQALICAAAVVVALRPGADPNDTLSGNLALAQFLVIVVGGITFLWWTYRVTANAHAFGAEGLRVSPGWAVGWYFVPIACLGMPFAALRDTWKASVEPRDWEIVKAPVLLPIWWGCWLVSNFAGIISARMLIEANPEMADAARILGAVSDVATIPASLILAIIVPRLTALQRARLAGGSVVAVARY